MGKKASAASKKLTENRPQEKEPRPKAKIQGGIRTQCDEAAPTPEAEGKQLKKKDDLVTG